MQIDFELSDDLNVAVDPDTYQDQANPAPPPAGTYKLQIEKWSVRKTQDGEVILTNNSSGVPTYPILVLEKVKLLEPFPYNDRIVGLYQDLKTAPKTRMGQTVSDLGDIVRALDQTQGFSGLKQGVQIFGQLAETTPFSATLDWYWYDSEFVRNQLDEQFDGRNYGELNPDEKRKAGEIYNKAKLQGMRKNKLPNGKFSHIWTGPSGNKLEAKLKIVRFYPSLASVKYYVVE